MNEQLKKAIDSFCSLIPEAKIGIYSHHPKDHERLAKIAYLSHVTNEEVANQNIIEGLAEKHDVHENDIRDCATSCLAIINEMKSTINEIDKLGYLKK